VRADERTTDGRTDTHGESNSRFSHLADDLISLPLVKRKSTPACHGVSAPREHRPVSGTPYSNKLSSLYNVASAVSV